MILLSPDEEFAMGLLMALFTFLAYGPAVKRWLTKVDPLDTLGRPPKGE